MTRWALLVAAITSEVTATLCLKGALEHPWLYPVVVLGYVASFVLLAMVLRRGLPLGLAYGVWAATGVAVTALLSTALYGEPLTALKGAGLALIVVGVVLVEVGSHRASSADAGVT